MPDMPEAFEIAIEIQPTDIDELGHVNNVTYLRWIQDVAVAHWRTLAPAADQARVYWVAVRHEIDYDRPALTGDAIIARTWVGTAQGMKFERHTEILRAADRTVLARCRTLWCPISAKTGRLTKVSAEVKALFSRA